MKKNSLSRLLTLRERLKKIEEAELARLESAKAVTALHLQNNLLARPQQTHEATALQDGAYLRELAALHLQALGEAARAQQHEVARANREERQVELIAQKRATQAAQLRTRREAAALDDWYRSVSWEKER